MDTKLLVILSLAVFILSTECAPKGKSGSSGTDESGEDDGSPEDNSSEDASKCLLPKEVGPCRGAKERYYFDPKMSLCRKFQYGGCRGNDNRFDNAEECKVACRVHLKPQRRSETPVEEDIDASSICTLPPIIGNKSCFAFMPRWTFNSTAGQCQRYIYGGCSGTKNLFRSEDECRNTCAPKNVERRAGDQSKSGVCDLPISTGPCFGSIARYGFNKEKNRCEKFMYGGCGGNENNFKEAQECQSTCGGKVMKNVDGGDLCSSVKCDLRIFQHYSQRGCKAMYLEGACCPSYYECPDPSVFDNKCFHDGKFFEIGEEMPEVTEQNPCRAGCFCMESAGKQHNTSVTCANVECPEKLGWLPEEQKMCTPTYEIGSCCASGFVNCKPHLITIGDDGTVVENVSPSPKLEPFCFHDDKQYVEGQRFYPKTAGASCQVCDCTAEFTDIFGPGCRTVSCTIRLPSAGCVPIYDEGVCCPYRYKCPSEYVTTEIRVVKPEEAQFTQNGPFITTGVAGKVPVRTLPALVDRGNVTSFVREGPFIQTGVPGKVPIRTLPARIDGGEFKRDGPFIETGVGGKIPVRTLPARIDGGEFKRDGPFIETGVPGKVPIRTLPARIDNGEFKRDGPFIETGMGGKVPIRTLPALVDPNLRQKAGRNDLIEKEAETAPDAENDKDQRRADKCTLQPVAGPCKMGYPRFAFNMATSSCDSFVYGGCAGNENRFLSEKECLSACKHRLHKSAGKDEACTGPHVTGPCRAHKTRFAFNPDTKVCETFTYGGCRGSANNHKSKDECELRCAPELVTVVPELEASVPVTPEPSITVAPYCMFGDVRFELGERLDTTEECVECTCSTPPELTCIKRSPCPRVTEVPPRPRVGAASKALPANDEIVELAQSIKPDVEAKLGRQFEVFEPVSYTRQVVAGYNYFIKIRVSDVAFLHVRLHKDFKQNLSLAGIQEDQTHESPLAYF